MRIALLTLAILLIALPALAYSPAAGNRAYPVEGTDYISGKTVSLADHAGKWVVLEFWAAW